MTLHSKQTLLQHLTTANMDESTNTHSSQHTTLVSRVGALLLAHAEPVPHNQIRTILEVSGDEVEGAIPALRENLHAVGMELVETGGTLSLGTLPEHHNDLEHLADTQHTGDLSKAALETLSIILYRGPLPQRDIDYIRGVNSSSILRSLGIRGLIVRNTSGSDARAALFEASPELLRLLGVGSQKDLPEYDTMVSAVETIQNESESDSS